MHINHYKSFMDKPYKYMDEAHRLKPMAEGYDRKLFETLYKETKALRKKLAFEIDSRRFGVDYHEVLSWFDCKFIHAFHRYQKDEKVKGYVINALRTFKYHIIKDSYLPKNQVFQQSTDINELYDYGILIEQAEEFYQEGDTTLDVVKKYLKHILSEDAYFLFELDLNPPPYILEKLQNPEQKKMPKIPVELVTEYLGISDNEFSYNYILNLRKDIEVGIETARFFFNN